MQHLLDPALRADERQIIGALLLVMSKHNVAVIVRDIGLQVDLPATPDMARVAAEIGQTEMTYLDVIDGLGRRLGTIQLIHGNGTDVIADYSWPRAHPEAEARLTAFVEHANAFGRAHA